jgi:hypothetical protein
MASTMDLAPLPVQATVLQRYHLNEKGDKWLLTLQYGKETVDVAIAKQAKPKKGKPLGKHACGESFADVHSTIHRCPAVYTSKQLLKAHQKVFHEFTVSKCPGEDGACEKIASDPQNLRKHIDDKHDPDKVRACPYGCYQGTWSNVDRHIERIHGDGSRVVLVGGRNQNRTRPVTPPVADPQPRLQPQQQPQRQQPAPAPPAGQQQADLALFADHQQPAQAHGAPAPQADAAPVVNENDDHPYLIGSGYGLAPGNYADLDAAGPLPAGTVTEDKAAYIDPALLTLGEASTRLETAFAPLSQFTHEEIPQQEHLQLQIRTEDFNHLVDDHTEVAPYTQPEYQTGSLNTSFSNHIEAAPTNSGPLLGDPALERTVTGWEQSTLDPALFDLDTNPVPAVTEPAPTNPVPFMGELSWIEDFNLDPVAVPHQLTLEGLGINSEEDMDAMNQIADEIMWP